MLVSQKELAAIFRVDPRTIRRWDEKGLSRARVKGADTRYDVAEAVGWRLEEVAPEDDAYRAALTRRAEAQAELAERELRVRASEVLESADVLALVRAPLEAVDRTLRAAPRRHAPALARAAEIPEAGALQLLEEIIEAARGELRELAADVT